MSTPKPSSPSVRIRYFPKQEVWAALREWVAQLPHVRPEVERVLLFGSLARDEAAPGSDVDLLLVLRESDMPFLDRIPYYTPSPFPVGVEVFAYTQEELEKMLKEGNPLLKRALSEGIELLK